MSTTVRPKRERPEADWDLVFKRNPVERIKRDKAPLGIRDELPALIAAGYEAVPEEDIVRLQWWGLYHDKPKIGTFMLRVKLPAGFVEPEKLRAIGEVSNRFGRGVGELATRQNVQLHHLALDSLPDVFAHLDAAGITTAGGCGDTVRNITGSPVQGIDPLELFDCTRRHPGGGRFLLRQPRLLEPAAQAQVLDRGHARPRQRARDQLHRARGRAARGARRGSACSSAAGSRRCRASRRSSACSSPRTRPSRCSRRSRAPGRPTSTTASAASRRASSS